MSWISLEMLCSQVLQPDGMPNGARWKMASMRRIWPYSTLNSSAICQVQVMR